MQEMAAVTVVEVAGGAQRRRSRLPPSPDPPAACRQAAARQDPYKDPKETNKQAPSHAHIMRPPMRSARSYTVTVCPALFSWSAAAMPAGPPPMTDTRLPVRTAGGVGLIQPSSKPCGSSDGAVGRDRQWRGEWWVVWRGDWVGGADVGRCVRSALAPVLCAEGSAAAHSGLPQTGRTTAPCPRWTPPWS